MGSQGQLPRCRLWNEYVYDVCKYCELQMKISKLEEERREDEWRSSGEKYVNFQ